MSRSVSNGKQKQQCRIILISSPSYLVILHDTVEVHTFISDVKTLFASPMIMVRLTEDQKGQTIAL